MTPQWDGPPLEAWDAWTPEEVVARLAGVAAPLLDEAATVWLRTMISRLYPCHPWLARLAP